MRSAKVLGSKYGCEPLIQYSLNSAVNNSGAVSPAARATASIMPVSIAGAAVGNTTLVTTCVGVAPIPIAASRILAGTPLIASFAVSKTVGNIKSASATPPAGAENLPVATTITAKLKTPARIEGNPVSTFAAKLTAEAVRVSGPNSLMKIAPSIPNGTLSTVAIATITRVPTIALPIPPPGAIAGGGSVVNVVMLNAATPC